MDISHFVVLVLMKDWDFVGLFISVEAEYGNGVSNDIKVSGFCWIVFNLEYSGRVC